MLGCIQPMSSPMMNRMLGFRCGACATAGAAIAADIRAVAPIRAALARMCRKRDLSALVCEDARSLVMGSSSLSDDAAEADMARRGVDRLRVTRCRTVAAAVVGRAQMRAALQHPARNPDPGLAGSVALVLGPAARVLG